MSNKIYLPINLDISDKKILLVGGGNVAFQKLKALTKFTKNITVLAPEISEETRSFKVNYIEQEYYKGFLEGYGLIYACTNIEELNQRIKDDAEEKKILINVVDNPSLCDFISPAIYSKDNMTISVSSNGTEVLKAIKWRDKIKDLFERSGD